MKKRIKKLYEANRKLLKRKERDAFNNYLKGYKRIDREIARVYKSYADSDGKLYMSEMLKYDRIKKTELEVARVIGKIYRENNKLTRQLLKDMSDKSYKSMIKEAEKQTSKRVPTINKDVFITEEVNKLVAGINWNDRNNKHKADLIYKAHGIIKDGLEHGKTYNTMANDIKGLLGDDISKPLTVARTEGHRIMESSKLEAVKDIEKAGIKVEKEWLTMGDERVRSSHTQMDGVRVKIDEEFTLPSGIKTQAPGLSGDPAEDINCRCILVYKFT